MNPNQLQHITTRAILNFSQSIHFNVLIMLRLSFGTQETKFDKYKNLIHSSVCSMCVRFAVEGFQSDVISNF